MMKIVLPTLIIAVVYFLATTYLMNSRLAVDTLTGNYPLTYKFNLLTTLILGMWSVMGTFGLTILLATAILTGANLTILSQRLTTMSKLGNVRFVVGGSSLLGVSGSLIYLPFRGLELSYLSIALLIVSLIMLVKTKPATGCKINSNTNFNLI